MKHPPLLSRIYMPGVVRRDEGTRDAPAPFSPLCSCLCSPVVLRWIFLRTLVPSFRSVSSAIKACAITHNGLIKKLSHTYIHTYTRINVYRDTARGIQQTEDDGHSGPGGCPEPISVRFLSRLEIESPRRLRS